VLLLLSDEGLCNASGFLLIITDHEDLTCIRDVIKAEDLSRYRRAGLADPIALIIEHCTNLAVACAGRNIVTDLESTLLHKDSGNRTTSLIELCFDDKTSCVTVRIGLQFKDISYQKDHVQEVTDTLAGLCGNRAHRRGAAPFFRDQAVLGQFLLDHVSIGSRLIHLVDGNDDFDACGLCMIDCFDRLRLDAVIRCDNEDRDIRGLRAS